jgi:hypothetical protein
MIIARGTRDGKELLMLGITQENLIALTEGKPMHLRRETHGDGIPPGWEVVIFYGKTSEDCTKQIRPAIGPDTKVISQPGL